MKAIKFISARLNILIQRASISIADLSSKSGVSQDLIYSILNDSDADPEVETLNNLCRALDTNLADFFKA